MHTNIVKFHLKKALLRYMRYDMEHFDSVYYDKKAAEITKKLYNKDELFNVDYASQLIKRYAELLTEKKLAYDVPFAERCLIGGLPPFMATELEKLQKKNKNKQAQM